MDGMQIDDLDLENFDDFEDNTSNDFQDAQEQWPEEIDFSPQDFPEEETTFGDEKEILNAPATHTSVSHIPQHSASRTVGQKWRPATAPEDSGRLVLPDASINLPGPSGLNTGKKAKMSQPVGYEPPQHIRMEASGSVRQRTTIVASVRPVVVEGDFCPSGSALTASPEVPTLMALPQTAHVWAANPLVRVKVSEICYLYLQSTPSGVDNDVFYYPHPGPLCACDWQAQAIGWQVVSGSGH